MNTCTASGIAARTWRAPCTSISSTTGTPARTRSLELGAQRAVAAPGVVGVLDELARGDAAVELLAREEVVVDAVALARRAARAWSPRPTAPAAGRRSISPRISVPLPTPEGPVMTNTRATARDPSAASRRERVGGRR